MTELALLDLSTHLGTSIIRPTPVRLQAPVNADFAPPRPTFHPPTKTTTFTEVSQIKPTDIDPELEEEFERKRIRRGTKIPTEWSSEKCQLYKSWLKHRYYLRKKAVRKTPDLLSRGSLIQKLRLAPRHLASISKNKTLALANVIGPIVGILSCTNRCVKNNAFTSAVQNKEENLPKIKTFLHTIDKTWYSFFLNPSTRLLTKSFFSQRKKEKKTS